MQENFKCLEIVMLGLALNEPQAVVTLVPSWLSDQGYKYFPPLQLVQAVCFRKRKRKEGQVEIRQNQTHQLNIGT